MIPYEQVKELGFVREDYHDNEVWKRTGYNPFKMTKQVQKNVVINWNGPKEPLEIVATYIGFNDVDKMEINSLEELIVTLVTYGFREEVKAFMENQVKV